MLKNSDVDNMMDM